MTKLSIHYTLADWLSDSELNDSGTEKVTDWLNDLLNYWMKNNWSAELAID